MKKALCSLLAVGCLMGTATTAFASTVPFDVTWPNDTISRKTSKNTDGDQYFYVTANYFSAVGGLTCVSYRHDKPTVYSNPAYLLYIDTGKTSKARYIYYADGGYNYYMTTETSINGLNVSGNYTP